MLVSYLLWIFLGWFGAHRFYLGRIVSGLILLALTILTFLIGMVTLGFGSFLMAIPAIWVLVDAFLIPGIVRRANQALIARL
ncbi:TM2 domain-containing protein [Futiania mangrovi]|uniref:TM2 domain-containing protein n=1 Tax=Futiania mangrovi TaxID=2959716 RepID=A0A9J6PEL1_9PROT|nr:TM2 domain-containing protein [Futiania mangrovii]MCP1335063.1 TM2 domain-containing protein [Futiania mangrovii]